MKASKHFGAFLLLMVFFSPLSAQKKPGMKPEKEAIVTMRTSLGNIRIKLYNQTPLHRDNFLKLAESGYYDSLLFHRVIKGFMIQGGDPDSKRAPYGTILGEGGPDYTIPAEFNPTLFHKKGALAAARESDLDNPLQASSGSQFYIVQGRVYTDTLLKVQANRISKMKMFNNIINRPENKQLLDNYKRYVAAETVDSIKYVNEVLSYQVDSALEKTPPFAFSPEQVAAYTTIGGTPHLDGSYTVFGEVIEGLEIVDLIANQRTDKNARPIEDIRILGITIENKP